MSRGRGISNTPAWMARGDQPNDHFDNGPPPRPGGGGGSGGGSGNGGESGRGGGSGPPQPSSRDHHRRQGPPQRYDPRHDRRHDRDYDERRHRGGYGGGYGGGGSNSRSSSRRRQSSNRSGIHFNSYEEERAWVEERRRRRHERKSLFDTTPTPDQLALEELQKAALASSGPNPSVFLRPEEIQAKQGIDMNGSVGNGGISGNMDASSLQPQQTRHARRLYVGNLPADLSENDVHDFFRSAIHTALGEDEKPTEDHILSVYINKDRRFAFIEFKTIDVCAACLALDGIDVCGKGKVKVKRPNDFNPALVQVNPNSDLMKQFDVSKLGIISTNVPDSPNKIFIGGLPYHLTDTDVLELLRAFGEVKAFNLVKVDTTAATSKGYCFVEYVDENVKNLAVMGLHGMDMGNGKKLSAKIATTSNSSHSAGLSSVVQPFVSSVGMQPINDSAAPPIMKVVDGVDIEALIDVAMGKSTLSAAGNHQSNLASGHNGQTNGGTNVLDVANAALAAVYGYQGN